MEQLLILQELWRYYIKETYWEKEYMFLEVSP